ncbi:hypothetical protein STEG23_022970 [Scotinomys teguina]
MEREQQEDGERTAGGWRENSRRMEREQQEDGERTAGGWRENSRRMEREQQEDGERTAGGWRENSRRMEREQAGKRGAECERRKGAVQRELTQKNKMSSENKGSSEESMSPQVLGALHSVSVRDHNKTEGEQVVMYGMCFPLLTGHARLSSTRTPCYEDQALWYSVVQDSLECKISLPNPGITAV